MTIKDIYFIVLVIIANKKGKQSLILSYTMSIDRFSYFFIFTIQNFARADPIKKFTPSLGIPFLGV